MGPLDIFFIGYCAGVATMIVIVAWITRTRA